VSAVPVTCRRSGYIGPSVDIVTLLPPIAAIWSADSGTILPKSLKSLSEQETMTPSISVISRSKPETFEMIDIHILKDKSFISSPSWKIRVVTYRAVSRRVDDIVSLFSDIESL
jgi:hypothetical protein